MRSACGLIASDAGYMGPFCDTRSEILPIVAGAELLIDGCLGVESW